MNTRTFALMISLAVAPLTGGAGVAVSIISDLPGQLHYTKVDGRWMKQEQQMASLLEQGREAAAIRGDTRQLSVRVSGDASTLDSFRIAGSLPEVDKTVRDAKPADALRRQMLAYHDGRRELGDRFPIPGGEQRRDTWIYADLAREDAVRERLVRALKNLDEVEEREERVVRGLHARLRGSPTEGEVMLVGTALQGVDARTAYARSQAHRARMELEALREARLSDLDRIERARAEELQGALRGLGASLPGIEGKGGLR